MHIHMGLKNVLKNKFSFILRMKWNILINFSIQKKQFNDKNILIHIEFYKILSTLTYIKKLK